MPGKKYRSIKKPKVYEALRRKGHSKQKAARISNAMAGHVKTKAKAAGVRKAKATKARKRAARRK